MRGVPAVVAVALVLTLSTRGRAEPTYVGDKVCIECHEDVTKAYSHTVHAKLFTPEHGYTATMKQGCEGCHGPSSEHVEATGNETGSMLTFRGENPTAIRAENAACLSCHQGGGRLHWQGSAHEMREVPCSSCHQIMKEVSKHGLLAKPTEADTCGTCHSLQISQLYRFGHMPLRSGAMPDREGKLECTSCHNAHGTVTDKLLIQQTVNDNCYSCHADKRGPFLWEHAPVAENCLNCHTPHGSTRPYMLKQSPPRLCQQCHVASRHPSDPYLPGSKLVIQTGCQNCHVNIHGSNHPSGEAFVR